MPARRTVLLVDDHPITRLGLRCLLEDHALFALCGEAGDVTAAHRLTEELRPDLIVLDLMLGGRDGPELIEDLLASHPAKILVFSSMKESDYAPRALKAGARGYVGKSEGLEAVEAALEKIAGGAYAFGEAVMRTLLDQAAGGKNGLEALSNRELQIFRLLGTGKETAAIAAELHLGVKTIGTYRERLKSKLHLGSARELEAAARDLARQADGR